MVVIERDLELLIALQENPLLPASKLAKAVNLSTPTVITRLDLLKQEKAYYKVVADLNSDALGFRILDAIIEINNLRNVEFFEKQICLKHPYTLFRSRCFGKTNGIYVQFRIPKGSHPLVVDLLDHLEKNKLIDNYYLPEQITSSLSVYSKANLSRWEPTFMRWNFDWDSWLEKLSEMDSQRQTSSESKSIVDRLDELDIALLQELTMDARRKNTEIMDALNLEKKEVGLPQRISRKLKFLNREAISQYRVFLRWEPFEIYNSFLIIADSSKKVSHQLQNLLLKEPISFESTFKLLENGFLWYIRCPATHFSDISAILLELCSKIQFFYLDYKKVAFYGLWKGAFDMKNHCWSTELMQKEFVLD